MKLEQAEIRVLRLPLLHPFQTSNQINVDKLFILLTLRSEGLEGYGESVMDEIPNWREETVTGALSLLKEQLLPAIMGKDVRTPNELMQHLSPFKGNRMAKATLEMAFWDLWAKRLGVPLSQLLGGTRESIPVGVSLGIQKSLEATLEQVEKHVNEGYKRIKLKIKPGWDLQVLGAVRERFPKIQLTADANSAYTLADLPTLRSMDEFKLDYLEQPLAFDDLHDHAKLQALMNTRICLDESIQDAGFARKALESDAARVINIKAGRVGGHLESRRVHDVAQSFGVPVWCGGMLESGIGRAHNIHLASLENFSKPGDTSSSSRYWKTDIINEALETTDGMMPVPTGAGIGVTLNHGFLKTITQSAEVVKP
jgi:o-succinylbenzoate synthase